MVAIRALPALLMVLIAGLPVAGVQAHGAALQAAAPSAAPASVNPATPAPADAPATPSTPQEAWASAIATAEAAKSGGDDSQFLAAATGALTLTEAHFADDATRMARALTLVGLAQIARNRPAEARDAIERALALMPLNAAGADVQAVAARRAESLALRTTLATALFAAGLMDDAEHQVIAALLLLGSDADPDSPDAFRAQTLRGQWLIASNRLSEAEALLLPLAERARTTLGKGHAAATDLTIAVGQLRRAQGQYADAAAALALAHVDLVGAIGTDHPATVRVAVMLAQLYFDSGKAAQAEPLLRQALTAYGHSGQATPHDALPAQLLLSAILSDDGEFDEAEQLAKSAIATAAARYADDHPVYAGALEALAQVYAAQNRYGLALPILQRAVDIRANSEGLAAVSTWTAQTDLARIYAGMGRSDDAQTLLRCLIAESTAALGENHPMPLEQSIQLASLLADRVDTVEARTLYERIVPQLAATMGADHPQTLNAQYGLGMLLWKQGEEARGEQYLTGAWQVSAATYGNDHPIALHFATALTNIRLRMPDLASTAVEPAAMIAEALRHRRQADIAADFANNNDSALFRQSAPSLTLYADALWQARTGKDSESVALALEALQNATAGGADQAVLQTAARRVAESRDPALGLLVREREALEKTLEATSAAYTALLGEAGDDAAARRGVLTTTRDSATIDLSRIDRSIRERFPEYFSLIRPEAVDLATITATLAPDEAILFVVPTEFGTHLVAVSRDASSWQRNEMHRGQVADAVRRLLYDVGASVQLTLDEDVTWQDEGGGGYPFARGVAWQLYQSLVAPMASVLAGKRHVFVVATGALSAMPFGMLVTAEPTGADGDPAALRDTAWLADAHALMQVPTIQSLVLQRRAAAASAVLATNGPVFAGFGDPLLNGEAAARGGGRGATRGDATVSADVMNPVAEQDGSRLANPSALLRMARLPGTATELASMREALNAPADTVHLRAEATEGRIRTLDLSGTTILAIATHGLMAGEGGADAEPGLVFTPPDKPTKEDDGLLTTSEIAGLELDAEWVILSACNTAAGDGGEGAPGLSGLAQAFFFAGAQTLLASHWPVRDDVAARITVRAIEIQRDIAGLSRAEAFQQAMREIRNDTSHDSATDTWAHPNAWAPFSLVGDGTR